ncbi:MAG: hypothetical protein DMF85_01475 [Acidobacteria bacterium]|nr:MAG: hypothetical protein DMF85_01475 [Acidobacteriota bacterium]
MNADAKALGQQREQARFVPDFQQQPLVQLRRQLLLQALPACTRSAIDHQDDLLRRGRIRRRG